VTTRVLIVDDHLEFRGLARAVLEQHGFTVVGEAGDCVSALAAADELQPDAVLLDIQLPDGNGFDVARELVMRSHAPAVVLTSSRDHEDLGSQLDRSGARGFIAKSRLSGLAFEELLDS
jgi:DNA-binding NarL/FixJ family response regulator